MIGYIVRRIAYGFLILLGVNALTFALFFAVNTPDDMARLAIGGRYVTPQAIENWKKAHGYDLPLVYNEQAEGVEKLTKTVFLRVRRRFWSVIWDSRTPVAASTAKSRSGWFRRLLWPFPPSCLECS